LVEVVLYIDVIATLDIVHDLKKMGWVIHKDFDFAYHKAIYNDFTGYNREPEESEHSVFTFYNDSNASYFMLRWG